MIIKKGSSRNSKLMCPVHQDKSLEYFCGPCKAVICGKCMIEEHRIHGEVKYATEVLEHHVTELKNIIVDAEKMTINGEVMLKSLMENSSVLDNALDNELTGVQSYFANIHEILNGKEEEIIIGMKTQANRKGKLIQKHFADITRALKGVEKSKQVFEDTVDKKAMDINLLLEEKQLCLQMQTGMRLVEESILDSNAARVVFSNLTPFVPDPALRCLCLDLQYSRRSKVKPSSPQTDLYQIHNKSNESARYSYRPFSTSEMSPDLLRRSSAVMSKRICKSSSEILQPVSMIETKNLTGPYNTVTAYPNSVCCLTEGTLLVTDSRHHLFRVVTSTGKCLQTIGSEGNGDGQFYEPRGVALDREENILVLDGKGAGRLQKFSVAGQW